MNNWGFNKLFYRGKELKNLKVDNSTTTITIPTPKDWKCKIKKCPIDWKHNHNLFINLTKK